VSQFIFNARILKDIRLMNGGGIWKYFSKKPGKKLGASSAKGGNKDGGFFNHELLKINMLLKEVI
jgi:hypothetical protein